MSLQLTSILKRLHFLGCWPGSSSYSRRPARGAAYQCGCWFRSRHYSAQEHVHVVTPITKVLVANRGEIACRVIRTARKMGIRSVACYSDADSQSLHVSMADEAYHIGRPPAAESYLCMEKIINVAKQSKAEAIHPGYGFLSEKPEFASLCEQEGIIFVGPPSSAIRDMGIKSTSKYIMSAAGVPIIEGYHGEDQTNEKLQAEAEKIGYPVMLKAVRGGGGKGMRIVMNKEGFHAGLASARNESMKAFGDSNMLVEKFVERPRHVEVQVFADKYGNTVYLFERDCSVQRRHQKIIEEAPAPGISSSVRQQIGEAAVRAAKAVGYVGAGTVEFILDKHQKFYFMEMNTRLQVEHPVTEMVTGVDLVELQLRAAAGEMLPFTQGDLGLKGHSFEARIYAEDPERRFLPGAGRLFYLSAPVPSKDVRIETGVRQGDEVSQFYDPMIAKLVVWDKSRSAALRKLRQKLHEYHVVGLSTNIKFLGNLSSHPSFAAGDVHTGFIDEHYHDLFPAKSKLSEKQIAQAALAMLLQERNAQLSKRKLIDPFSPFHSTRGFRLNKVLEKMVPLSDGERDIKVHVTYKPDDSFLIQVEKREFLCLGELTTEDGRSVLKADIDGVRQTYSVVLHGDGLNVFTQDGHFEVYRTKPRFIREKSEKVAPSGAVAPMTGTILEIRKSVGDSVNPGDVVAIIYAMKLEHSIVAPYGGVVEDVFVKPGTLVEKNAKILEIKKNEG